MKKVWVTGASGLIGKESLEPLAQASRVRSTATGSRRRTEARLMRAQQEAQAGFEIYSERFELFDKNEIQRVMEAEKPEYLLHFAWCTTGDYLTSDENYKFLEASKNLIEAFKSNGGRRLMCAGTCFEELAPETIYAQCKNELRRYVGQSGLDYAWGRIYYVFGHGEHPKRLTPHLINSLREDKEVTIFNGSLIRDYMYTKDIAAGFAAVLDSEITGIADICTGKGVSLGDYAMKIARKLGKTELVKILNEPTDQPHLIVGDNTKLSAVFKPKYSIDEAIDEILKDAV
jgi:nucleoside-diphosphate-sugar epimerase